MATKTQIIWLANELINISNEIKGHQDDSDENIIPKWVGDRISYLAGSATALKAGESDE